MQLASSNKWVNLMHFPGAEILQQSSKQSVTGVTLIS